MKPRSLLTFILTTLCLIVAVPADADAWRSTLYDDDWVPPHTLSEPPSFETDKVIQDFSYAGYRRSEAELPEVTGPIFDAVADYGADPTGESNSTGEIQDALDAAADAGGGVVYLPAGTYRVRPAGDAPASLRIRSDNVILRGAGPSQTFILNDSWEMNRTDIIRVDAPSSGWPNVPDDSPETAIRHDLMGPAKEIPVDDASAFSPDDWVVVRADATDPFKAEHNMEDLWVGQGLGPGVFFIRQILSIDEETDTLFIDVPTRYYLKTRDDARVHLLNPHIEEIGLEDFSIGNVEHPNHDASSGWGTSDYNEDGAHAEDVHASYAIRMARVRNGWIRNVETYRPEENSLNAHVLSNAVRIGNSVNITVKDSHFERAMYAGGGGNAYMLRVTNSQEVLMQDTTVGYNRHGFVFSHMQTSGNVIHRGRAEHTGWRALSGGAGSSGSDHHMWLSQSNLVDNTQLLEDYFAAYYRHTWGSNHGHSATHSVFWNLEGLEYFSNSSAIVNTQQARYGYAIGTRGAATGISTSGTASWANEAHRTEPVDHVEGEGEGDSLEPRSLFENQLRMRMTGPLPEGRVVTPEITPHGGTYEEPRTVEIATETDGATIYYTLNGAAPTTDSAVYDGPLELDEDTNLRAIAVADGYATSRLSSANFRFPDTACLDVVDLWQSTPISLQDGEFEVEFHATPQDQEMNSVMGLSFGDAQRYQDLAAIVRFSPDGVIDARNAGAYEAFASLEYEASTTYFFRFIVDVENRTYDAYVQPEGEDEVLIADAFDFRSEQGEAFQLNRFSTFAAAGENQICDLLVPADHEPEEPEEPENGTPDAGGDVGESQEDDVGDEPEPDVGTPTPITPDAGEPEDTGDSELSSESGCSGCSSQSSPAGSLFVLVALMGVWVIRRRTDNHRQILGPELRRLDSRRE